MFDLGDPVSICRHVYHRILIVLQHCTKLLFLELKWPEEFLYTFVHLYSLLYKRLTEKEDKKKIRTCSLLWYSNIFIIKVLYCYDLRCVFMCYLWLLTEFIINVVVMFSQKELLMFSRRNGNLHLIITRKTTRYPNIQVPLYSDYWAHLNINHTH